MNFTTDLSSNNAAPNLDQHWAAGHRILILKTSEGTRYTWDGSKALADRWHAKGGIVGHYHFLTPGDGAQQAEWFFDHVRPQLGTGDFFVVDVETAGDSAAEVNSFIDRLSLHRLERGLIYGSPGFLGPNKIVSRHGWRLWVAHYTSAPEPQLPAGWDDWTVWQFTDRAKVPGCPQPVDYSRYKDWLAQPTLKSGDRSFAVYQLKVALRAAGYGRGLVMNQRYGMATRVNVNRLKRRHGWTPDGVAGPRVWAALTRKGN